MGNQPKRVQWDTGANDHQTTNIPGMTYCGQSTATTTGGNKHKRLKLGVEIKILKAKPVKAKNKIIEGHVPETRVEPTPRTETTSTKTNTDQKREDGWVLPRELLDDGQGKSTSDMEISESSDSKRDTSNTGGNENAPEHATPRADNWNKHILLRPPIIKTTGKIATGATTSKLRKQNKLHRMNCLLQQPLVLQWERHNGATQYYQGTIGINSKKHLTLRKWHRRDSH